MLPAPKPQRRAFGFWRVTLPFLCISIYFYFISVTITAFWHATGFPPLQRSQTHVLQRSSRNLLSTVSRQTVHYHRPRFCRSHQFIIDLISLECLLADLLLFFLTHGSPCICDDNVCIFHCLDRIITSVNASLPAAKSSTSFAGR